MDRLTRKSEISDMVWFIDREHKSGYAERGPCYMGAHHARLAIAKLAEYEDFEEIFRSKMTDAACDFLKDKEEFAKWLDRNKWIAKKCDEYARAEEQGKLPKLPCAVGDTVYAYCSVFGILAYTVDCIVIGKNIVFQCSSYSETIGDYVSECLDEIEPDISDFGKTVFLTREEAEAALKELRTSKQP